MRFEWDEDENRRNLAKHKVSFETASQVFDDPQALSVQDRVMTSGLVIIVATTFPADADGLVRLDFSTRGDRA
jgi:uncharacterized DUF497 family protein